MIKAIVFMMIITFSGKILGLFRDALFAGSFGTGETAAAFTAASTAPRTFLDVLFASAISASFIPIFSDCLQKEGRAAAYRFANNFITMMCIVSIFLTSLLSSFSLEIMNFTLARNFNASTVLQAKDLFLVMLPLIWLSVLAFSIVGILQSQNAFNAPAAMSLASNTVIIAYYLLFMEKFGVFGLAVAFVLGWAAQVIILLPSLKKLDYRYKFVFDLNDARMRRVFLLMLPVMFSTWAQPVNLYVNTVIANGKDERFGAALNYANNLFIILTGIFVLSVSNVIFTKLSAQASKNDDLQFGKTILGTSRALIFFLTPMTFGLFVVSEPVVSLVYGRGEFDAVSAALTTDALKFLSFGMLGYGFMTVLSRAFYANKDGKTPMITGLFAIVLNFTFSNFLVKVMGIGGIGLASSISVSTVALYMYIKIYNQNKNVGNKTMLKDFFLVLISSILMSLTVSVAFRYANSALFESFFGQTILIILSATIGISVYLFTTKLFKISEANIIFDFIMNKFKSGFNKEGRQIGK